jgi:hypothetical protein
MESSLPEGIADKQPSSSPLDAALDYLKANLSIIRIKPDGSKRPALSYWTWLQKRLPPEGIVRNWWDDGLNGIGIVCGAVSGNLECIDFDRGELFAPWRDLVEAQAPGLVARLCVVRTPRAPAGYHAYYRCPSVTIPGSMKLAQEPGINGQTGKPCLNTMIETRGEGGYALAPGSPPACHETGRSYQHIAGPPLTELPEITAQDRELLIAAARSFDLATAAKTKCSDEANNTVGDLRPGDDFNQRGPSWPSILEPHGWEQAFSRGETTYWRRPDKDSPGISATTGYCKGQDGAELLAVFSTNAFPFEGANGTSPCTCYGKFAAYTLLNHKGDFSAAARELASQGYGDRVTRHDGHAGEDRSQDTVSPDGKSVLGGDSRMTPPELDTEQLMRRAGQGEAAARGQLLERYRLLNKTCRLDSSRRPAHDLNKSRPTGRKLRAKDRPLANDYVSDPEFERLLQAWFGNIARVLQPGRTFYIWGGYANCGNYPPVLKATGLYFSQAIIWVKEHPVLTRKDFMGNHEWAFYGWRQGAAHQFFGPTNAVDVWSVKKVNPQSMVHLTEKPVELAMRALQYSSRAGVTAPKWDEYAPPVVTPREIKDVFKAPLGLPPGWHHYYNALVLLNPGPKDTALVKDVALERPTERKGRVVGPDGKPLTGVTVDGSGVVKGAEVIVRGLNPRAPAGRTLIFYHKGKNLGCFLKSLPAEKDDPFTVKLQPCGSASGRLVDSDGVPQAGLHCRSGLAGPAARSLDFTTDKEGRFRVEHLVPGLTYWIEKPNALATILFQFTVEPSKHKDLGDLKVDN